MSWSKGDFIGREALAAQKELGVSPLLRGLSVAGKRPPRAEMGVLHGDAVIGTITSGNFSPMLGHGIAMAYLHAEITVGTSVRIDARGRLLDATVVDLPFLPKA
ncbi:MAG: glycine cleavage T C-terminal barrel domain-containing protein [Microthrixaceae bacterium]